ncbi:MAG: putative LytR family regulatory protein [Ilumatobacteraceae bacterium]|nr:putative LytR family regulatory protein [Ilumatobacteraceae bacterium]
MRGNQTDLVFTDRFEALASIAHRVSFRILGDRHLAEEIAQEALARAYSRWTKVVPTPAERTSAEVGDGIPGAAPVATAATAVAPDSASVSAASGASTASTTAPGLTHATTYLIVGVDARADDPAIGSRGDTIMLLRVDPSTDTVRLLSVPRDLWVTVPGSSRPGRINATAKPDNPEDLVSAPETSTRASRSTAADA